MKDGIVTRIRTLMAHYNLSVSAFADTIGVQRSSISHLLSGRNNPSLDLVLKLVHTYPEVNLYWLLRGEGTFPSAKAAAAVSTPGVTYPKEEEQLLLHPKPLGGEPFQSPSRQPLRVVFFYTDGTFETFDLKKE